MTRCTLNGVGKTYTLQLNAPTNTVATWDSSTPSIASVSEDGVVTAKRKGSATITCTAKNQKTTKKLFCKVTVKVPAKAIIFTNASIVNEYYTQPVNNKTIRLDLSSLYPADQNVPLELTLSGITSLVGKETKNIYTRCQHLYTCSTRARTRLRAKPKIVTI